MGTEQSAEQEQQGQVIHGVVFERDLPQKIQLLLAKPFVKRTLEGDVIRKDFGSFDDPWKSIFKYMIKASNVIYFSLYGNHHSEIIQNISRPNFTELRSLTLDDNNIVSIQQLQFINMPNLHGLHVGSNQITTISALNKCNWKKLEKLSLYNNPIRTFEISRFLSIDQTEQPNCSLEISSNIFQGDKLMFTMAKINTNRIYYYFRQDPSLFTSKLRLCMGQKRIKFQDKFPL